MKLKYFPLIFLHLIFIIKLISHNGFISSPDLLPFLLSLGFPVMALVFISNIYLLKKEGNHYLKFILITLVIILGEFFIFREIFYPAFFLIINFIILLAFSIFFSRKLKLDKNKPLSYKTPGLILLLLVFAEVVVAWAIYPPFLSDIFEDLKIIFVGLFYSIPITILIFFSNKYSAINNINPYIRLPIISLVSTFLITLVIWGYTYFTCEGESCVGLVFLPIIAGIYLIGLIIFSLIIAYFLNKE